MSLIGGWILHTRYFPPFDLNGYTHSDITDCHFLTKDGNENSAKEATQIERRSLKKRVPYRGEVIPRAKSKKLHPEGRLRHVFSPFRRHEDLRLVPFFLRLSVFKKYLARVTGWIDSDNEEQQPALTVCRTTPSLRSLPYLCRTYNYTVTCPMFPVGS